MKSPRLFLLPAVFGIIQFAMCQPPVAPGPALRFTGCHVIVQTSRPKPSTRDK
jgi:hypothetical protein